MPYRIAAYIILFSCIGMMGAFFAKLTEYSGMSQYTSNFIYGVIIILFVIENRTLIHDLNEKIDVINDEKVKNRRSKDLAETNNSLAIENANLRGRIARNSPLNKVLKYKSPTIIPHLSESKVPKIETDEAL